MSMHRADDGWEIECDFCNRRWEFYPGNWHEAYRAAKLDGWRATKDTPGELCHRCLDCAEELAREAAK